MLKKKLAFIDYWHHELTRSGDFLRDILSKEFEITNFWWKPKTKFPIDELQQFDHIFFFHVMFPYQAMKRLIQKKILWAPMYDALIFKNNFERKIFWRQISLLGIKILEFSKKVSESINKENIEILKVQYFIKTEKNDEYKKTNKIKIFFWDRGQIEFKDWIKLFNPDDIDEIIYYPVVDPSRKIKNSLYEYKNVKIKVLKKNFLPKHEYLELMKSCHVFIAPRKKEGIGMSIVEALARGMYIVGYNDSTMNEYITNEKIGYLFDNNTNKIAIRNILNEYEFRLSNSELNYSKWLLQEHKITPFFNQENQYNNKKKIDYFLFYDDLKFYLKKFLNKNRFIY